MPDLSARTYARRISSRARDYLIVPRSSRESLLMDAKTIVSAAAAVIPLAALGLPIHQTRLTRAHNRLSVQPVLDFAESYRRGQRAGLRLHNVGLGPARIISGEVWLNGQRRSEPFGRPAIEALRGELSANQRRTLLEPYYQPTMTPSSSASTSLSRIMTRNWSTSSEGCGSCSNTGRCTEIKNDLNGPANKKLHRPPRE